MLDFNLVEELLTDIIKDYKKSFEEKNLYPNIDNIEDKVKKLEKLQEQLEEPKKSEKFINFLEIDFLMSPREQIKFKKVIDKYLGRFIDLYNDYALLEEKVYDDLKLDIVNGYISKEGKFYKRREEPIFIIPKNKEEAFLFTRGKEIDKRSKTTSLDKMFKFIEKYQTKPMFSLNEVIKNRSNELYLPQQPPPDYIFVSNADKYPFQGTVLHVMMDKYENKIY